MISLKVLREYYEDIALRVEDVHAVKVVNVDKDMSECLLSLKDEQLPVLFVVVPSSEETTANPDDISENNLCLVFLMDKADPQRRPDVQVLEDTQPLIEHIKDLMRKDKASGCHVMRGLGNMNTNPETGFYTDYSGWSVSFKLETT